MRVWDKQLNCIAQLELGDAITAVDVASCLVDGRYVIAVGLESGELKVLSNTPGDAIIEEVTTQ